MHLTCSACTIRPWQLSDKESLLRHANNYKIWINLRDYFPHPYTGADADSWLSFARQQQPATNFALAVGTEAVGGMGLMLHEDVERTSAEVGYWLGEAYWGQGISTAALSLFTRWAMANFSLTRLYALPFSHNQASIRVLQKVGYRQEGVLRRSAIKHGRVVNQELWAITDLDLQEDGKETNPDKRA